MLDYLLEQPTSFDADLEDAYDKWLYRNCKCHPSGDDCKCLSFDEWCASELERIADSADPDAYSEKYG